MALNSTADLLSRAAAQLARSYFEEVEKERDCRWAEDHEQADVHKSEAADLRKLAEDCRTAAFQFADQETFFRGRVRRRPVNLPASAAH